MKKFKAYSINLSSLSEGDYTFDYQIDRKFFEEFEKSLITNGKIQATIAFQKHTTFLDLTIDIHGTVQSICDICAEELDLAIEGKEELVVKFVEEIPETDNPEVLYLAMGTSFLNVANMLYELITLSLPIRKVHPTDEQGNYTCNSIALQYLNNNQGGEEEDYTESTEESISNNPMWDALQKLKDNKN